MEEEEEEFYGGGKGAKRDPRRKGKERMIRKGLGSSKGKGSLIKEDIGRREGKRGGREWDGDQKRERIESVK